MIYRCTIDTPLGPMTAAAEHEALIGLWFEGQKHYPPAAESWRVDPEQGVFVELRRWLTAYFAGGRVPGPLPRLAPKGTPFQLAVWEVLRGIAYGETTSYGRIAAELALRAGRPSMSAQAVGGAVGRNPLSILIPCHRVVGFDRRLTGYAGGMQRKEALLRLEGESGTQA
jgi:methylated-DNA-[protein]-cysteine S-methyltransferase